MKNKGAAEAKKKKARLLNELHIAAFNMASVCIELKTQKPEYSIALLQLSDELGQLINRYAQEDYKK